MHAIRQQAGPIWNTRLNPLVVVCKYQTPLTREAFMVASHVFVAGAAP
jgi:hypothetical protein